MRCVLELLFETYNAEKSYVCTVRTSNWSSDNNRLVEFFSTHMLFTPLWLVLIAQLLISLSLTGESTFVRRQDMPLVVHLLEPPIKRCLTGV